MRRSHITLALAFGAALGLLQSPAFAAEGTVTVFQTELQPLSVYENPRGCHKLPAAAHVLANETDRPVRIYGDPFCLGPSLTVAPGYGSHVAPGSGSFSA
ncbi:MULTISPECIES: hypothetical protein [unclassified Streptomyces]|uniref:hypothetical protein n=1 Tax=unclassified Streptomyces TaxID=2593676 RepID=UPI001CB730BF|nr:MULTISPECIES: hypothetical protein [unclassified Streptomyces]MBD0710633.1 hypothetical protein [Streptomyces sp. CBMA291]MBD0715480.1 hypothetical protein [Streptomyces sp. CBMA370]